MCHTASVSVKNIRDSNVILIMTEIFLPAFSVYFSVQSSVYQVTVFASAKDDA